MHAWLAGGWDGDVKTLTEGEGTYLRSGGSRMRRPSLPWTPRPKSSRVISLPRRRRAGSGVSLSIATTATSVHTPNPLSSRGESGSRHVGDWDFLVEDRRSF